MYGKLASSPYGKDFIFALKLNKYITWILGVWPFDCEDCFSKIRFAFVITCQFWVLTMQVLSIVKNCGDLDDLSDNILLASCSAQNLANIITIRTNMAHFRKVLTSVVDNWTVIEDSESAAISRSFVRFGNRACYLQLSCAYVSAIIFVLSPAAGLVSVFTAPFDNDTNWDRGASAVPRKDLPFKTACVYGHSTDLVYASTYIMESLTAFFVAQGNVGLHNFFFNLAMYVSGQLAVLNNDISKIQRRSGRYNGLTDEVREVIRRHSELIHVAKLLSEAVSELFFVQILLCCVVYLILSIRILMALKSGSTTEATRIFVNVNILIFQIFMSNLAGDNIARQCNSVQDNVYSINWHELPVKVRMDLRYIILRSNVPVYLSAGRFYALHLENFTRLVKTTFSYLGIFRLIFEA